MDIGFSQSWVPVPASPQSLHLNLGKVTNLSVLPLFYTWCMGGLGLPEHMTTDLVA